MVTGSSYWPVIPQTTICRTIPPKEWYCLFYDLAKFTLETVGSQLLVSEHCRNIRGWSQSSDLDVWLAGVCNLVKDDIKALNESSCKLRITQIDILSSPANIWTQESQPFIHTWGFGHTPEGKSRTEKTSHLTGDSGSAAGVANDDEGAAVRRNY